jgi:hypothetical protein
MLDQLNSTNTSKIACQAPKEPIYMKQQEIDLAY